MHPGCPDYDLCEACEAHPIPLHPPSHPFLKLRSMDVLVPLVHRYSDYTPATPHVTEEGASTSLLEDKRFDQLLMRCADDTSRVDAAMQTAEVDDSTQLSGPWKQYSDHSRDLCNSGVFDNLQRISPCRTQISEHHSLRSSEHDILVSRMFSIH